MMYGIMVRLMLKTFFSDSLLKNFSFLVLNTFLGNCLGFIFWIIVARNYSPETMGLSISLFSLAQLIISLSGFGLGFGLTRFLADSDNKIEMINTCLISIYFSTLIISTICVLGIPIWLPSLKFLIDDFLLLTIFLIFTVFFSVYTFDSTIFVASKCSKFYFLQDTLFNSIKIVFVFFLIAFGLMGIISSFTFSVLILVIVSAYFLKIIYPTVLTDFSFNKKVLVKLLPFSIGNYLASNIGSLTSSIMPLIIVSLLGAEKTAYYYTSWSLATVLFLISSAITTSLFAEGANNIEDFTRNVKKSIKVLFCILLPAVIFFIIFGEQLLLLYGKTYANNSFELLIIFVISSIPYSILQVYITICRIEVKIKRIILLNLVLTGSVLISSYFLISKIGLMGIGIAWLLTNCIIAMGVTFPILKILKCQISP